MRIDISKVNLLEKDIEDWLYENPGALGERFPGWTPIARWIGRQYNLPTGIADLIGVRENGKVAVIEIKNVPINKAAVLQVCRYATDVEDILGDRNGYEFKSKHGSAHVERILVGPSIDSQTFYEAQACGVIVYQFDAHVELTIGELEQSGDQYRAHMAYIEQISIRDEWAAFGLHYKELARQEPPSDEGYQQDGPADAIDPPD